MSQGHWHAGDPSGDHRRAEETGFPDSPVKHIVPTEAGLSLFGVLKQADPALVDPLNKDQHNRSATCIDCDSRLVVTLSSLFSNTFSIAAFSGKTSATSSCKPALRAIDERCRKRAVPIPWL